jgi:hypothetical protein
VSVRFRRFEAVRARVVLAVALICCAPVAVTAGDGFAGQRSVTIDVGKTVRLALSIRRTTGIRTSSGTGHGKKRSGVCA